MRAFRLAGNGLLRFLHRAAVKYRRRTRIYLPATQPASNDTNYTGAAAAAHLLTSLTADVISDVSSRVGGDASEQVTPIAASLNNSAYYADLVRRCVPRNPNRRIVCVCVCESLPSLSVCFSRTVILQKKKSASEK